MAPIAGLCRDMEQWIVGHVPTRSLLGGPTNTAVVCADSTVDVPVFQPITGATAHHTLLVSALHEQATAFFTGWWAEARTLVPWLLDGPKLTINLAHWTPDGTNLWVRPPNRADGFVGRIGVSLQPGRIRASLHEILPFFAALGPTNGQAYDTPNHGWFWARDPQDAAAIAARTGDALPFWSRR